VPVQYSLWITNERDQCFGDFYGYPLTGYAFRYWWSYWYRWLLGDRHFEQDADPPLVVYVPNEMVQDPENPNGDPIPAQELGMMIGNAVRDGATIAIPSEPYENESEGRLAPTAKKWAVEFLKGGENLRAFNDSFEYLDVMKLRALLVPEQALVEGKGATSSRNVASVYGAIFAQSQAITAQELDQHINDFMIPDLVAQNFADAPSVRKVTTGFTNTDEQLMEQLVGTLAQVDPNWLDLDTRQMAKSLGLPLLSPERSKERREEIAAVNIPPTAGGPAIAANPSTAAAGGDKPGTVGE
jgi:hypothetical protein